MVPTVAVPPVTPPAAHVTAVFVEFVTVAVHWKVCPATKVEGHDPMAIATAGVGVGVVVVVLPPPPQPDKNNDTKKTVTKCFISNFASWALEDFIIKISDSPRISAAPTLNMKVFSNRDLRWANLPRHNAPSRAHGNATRWINPR